MKVVLIGFACCFKSSAGKLLAEKLNYKHFDVDRLVEQAACKSIADIFASEGERAFREWESNALSALVDADDAVISCGGGSALLPSFASIADRSTVVWLTAQAETVVSRLSGDGSRPLFDGKTASEIQALMDERSRRYARFADVTVATDGLTPLQTADIIYSKLCG